ncbi:uncharacterized protein PAE49_012770 isoform 4-T4 [Odontesthes bonariensis]|uniref:uncharacterized protein LOC142391928 isoform X4 n=1 Tax=Odontesthes bonariensis TaxID=219752 RepID=UPI003F58B2A2
MKPALRIVSLLLLVSGTLTQDGELDLLDAFGAVDPPAEKPKKPSSGDSGGFDRFDLEDSLKPDPQTDKPPVKPPKSGGGGGSFDDSDLFDMSGGDYKPDGGRSGGELDLLDSFGAVDPPAEKPKKPSSGDSGGFDRFDLEDSLKPDPQTDKPPVKPPKSGGGGGSFDDSDLFDVSGGDYKPDGGRSGGRASDPGLDPDGPVDQPQGGGSFDDSDLFDVSGGDYKPDGGRSGGRASDPGRDPDGPVDQPQGELDLLDSFGAVDPPAEKPKKPSSGDSGGFDRFDLEDTLKPDPQTDKPPVKPPKSGGGGGSFDDSDLFDVSGGDYKPDAGRSGGRASDPGLDPDGPVDQPQGELDLLDSFGAVDPPAEKPKKPSSGDSGGFDRFDLEDTLKPDPQTDKPPVKPPKSGGGRGSFDDSDLFDVSGGDYKPDGGRSGGRASDPGLDPDGLVDQPQDGNGFNLADALRPGPQTPKPAGGNGAGFRLEDALRPAGKPTDEPSGGDCQGSVVQKLSTVLQNLLLQLLAGSSPAAMA